MSTMVEKETIQHWSIPIDPNPQHQFYCNLLFFPLTTPDSPCTLWTVHSSQLTYQTNWIGIIIATHSNSKCITKSQSSLHSLKFGENELWNLIFTHWWHKIIVALVTNIMGIIPMTRNASKMKIFKDKLFYGHVSVIGFKLYIKYWVNFISCFWQLVLMLRCFLA